MNCKMNKLNFNNISLLNELFEKREDNIYRITEQEKDLNKKQAQNYSKMYNAIDNIPEAFTETIKGIKESIETYLDSLSATQAMENEKFYKTGFSDAIQIFAECLCQNSDNKKEL